MPGDTALAVTAERHAVTFLSRTYAAGPSQGCPALSAQPVPPQVGGGRVLQPSRDGVPRGGSRPRALPILCVVVAERTRPGGSLPAWAQGTASARAGLRRWPRAARHWPAGNRGCRGRSPRRGFAWTAAAPPPLLRLAPREGPGGAGTCPVPAAWQPRCQEPPRETAKTELARPVFQERTWSIEGLRNLPEAALRLEPRPSLQARVRASPEAAWAAERPLLIIRLHWLLLPFIFQLIRESKRLPKSEAIHAAGRSRRTHVCPQPCRRPQKGCLCQVSECEQLRSVLGK